MYILYVVIESTHISIRLPIICLLVLYICLLLNIGVPGASIPGRSSSCIRLSERPVTTRGRLSKLRSSILHPQTRLSEARTCLLG